MLSAGGREWTVRYEPAESTTKIFGGNSNWRGPIWFPTAFMLITALRVYDRFFADGTKIQCPTGSGNKMHLGHVSEELERRLSSLFVPDANGRRPCHGTSTRYANDPHFRDLVLFHEYFHGDNGKGLGASHQTGWTALAANLIERAATSRSEK